MDLQALYKERLQQLVILDPPFFLNLIYNVVSPFLDATTRQKVVMVSGDAERRRVVTATPQRHKALGWLLLPTTEKDKKAVTFDLSVDTFLHKIHFYEYYNLASPSLASLP